MLIDDTFCAQRGAQQAVEQNGGVVLRLLADTIFTLDNDQLLA